MSMDMKDTPDWQAHIEAVPRPVFAVRTAMVAERWEHAERHQHRKAQLLYTVRGIIHCETDAGVWIVPPQCAVWIPSDMPHSARGLGDIECYCLFVTPEAARALPTSCCTLSVSPLMRELLVRAERLEPAYDLEGAAGRLVGVLLDELAQAPVENLHLPMPADERLKKLADMMLANPTDPASLTQWASRIALSERSLSRLLLQEVGMSFGRWRRQLHIILALQRLTAGDAVQTVALDLGYESASGFVTMFRKALGKPPARYLAERQGSYSQ